MTNMEKPFKELVNLVNQWAEEKGIHEKSDGIHQLYKTEEEVEEFISHTPKQEEELADDLGDIVVTLINYCYFKGIDIAEIYNEINKPIPHYRFTKQHLDNLLRSSLVVLVYGEEYVKNDVIIRVGVTNVLQVVLEGCHFIGRPVEECLKGAYEVISKRKGKVVGGIFIKES